MNEELKPCPRCGGKAKKQYYVHICSRVWCTFCGLQIVKTDNYEEGDSMPRAIDAWNRRMSDEKTDNT